MVDSQSIFDVISRLSKTTEKRLTKDVFSLQEAHRHGDLTSLFRIPSMENLADPLTKIPFQPKSALRLLMQSNRLQVKYEGWCLRGPAVKH